MMVWTAAARWLVLEGVVPLLGATVLFLLWGGARWATENNKSQFKFHWKEARDPMGWLYGSAVLAVQTALLNATITDGPVILSTMCWLAAAVSFFLLLSAMTNRGEKPAWKPPASLEVVVVLLILAVLYAGYSVHALVLTGGAK